MLEEYEIGHPNNMLLDVLAQAAAELEKQPPHKIVSTMSTTKKMAMKKANTFNLDELLEINEKQLVLMFAQPSQNELSRKFSFICQLMPEICSAQFSSYGNEKKAFQMMKVHMAEHLKSLIEMENTEFIASSYIWKTCIDSKAPKKKGKRLKDNIQLQCRSDQVLVSTHLVSAVAPLEDSLEAKCVNVEPLIKVEPPPALPEVVEEVVIQEHSDASIKEKEQIVLDVLSCYQPYHDHPYTTIFGQRTHDEPNLSSHLSKNDNSETKALYVSMPSNEMSPVNHSLHVPIVYITNVPEKVDCTPLVGAEEIVGSNMRSVRARYPPMPKSDNGKKGKLILPEEEPSFSENGPDDEKDYFGDVNSSSDPNWEKKTALKYIRELRSKNKVENSSLTCKICLTKKFTAPATLIYHYRSHAGIKPFVCLICNTTFTRQHSLNYHMLIHNNQSRFTCRECGRKFRHPSHFKEHIRRHTGETPYHCPDCPLRFKTRNTFKRHLKTRHGKILTAEGTLHQVNQTSTSATKLMASQIAKETYQFASANKLMEFCTQVTGKDQDLLTVDSLP